jgi:hypothetical protein
MLLQTINPITIQTARTKQVLVSNGRTTAFVGAHFTPKLKRETTAQKHAVFVNN